jgi:hypothetical protein
LTPTTSSLSGYTETIIHNFTGVPGGSTPQATLLYRFVRGIDGTYPAAPLHEDNHGAI